MNDIQLGDGEQFAVDSGVTVTHWSTSILGSFDNLLSRVPATRRC